MCNCKNQSDLVEISSSHNEFTKNLTQVSVGNWALLMQCSSCSQLWIVEDWDKYQSVYATKISSPLNWEYFEYQALIKEKIVSNRGGLSLKKCLQSGCENVQVKGSAYCVNHLFETGARA